MLARGSAALAVGVGWAGSGAAFANPLPPATFDLSLEVLGAYGGGLSAPGTDTINYCRELGSCGSASGTMTSNVNGEQSISGSAMTFQDLGVQSEITIDYYFRGDGPAGGTVVFDWEASGATSISGGGMATASLYEDGTLVAFACSSSMTGYCAVGDAFAFNTKFSAPANATQVIEIDLIGGTTPFGGGPFSAAIDPLITIDPSSVAAGYSLELSPNVTQSVVAPSVPEPSTWTMLLAGFAALGFAYRVRRRAPAAHRRG